MKFNISIIILLLSGFISFGQTNFREITNVPFVGVKQVSSDVADVDGDGDLDLLYCGKTNTFKSVTLLYLNDGYGSYSLDSNNNFQGLYVGFIRFSDIDNDGDSDFLMYGMDDSDSLHLDFYLNNGFGVFNKKNNTNLPLLKWIGFQFGDVDGDNDEDLIFKGVNSSNTTYTYLFTNNGAGDFQQDTVIQTIDFVQYLKFIDLDNDSDLDLFIKENYNAIYYENNGLGKFTIKTLQNVPTNSKTYSFGDFDNDSLLDITVSGSYSNGYVTTTFLNKGNLNFTEGQFGLSGFDPPTIYWNDLNMDGYNDILIRGYYRKDKFIRSKIYYGDGTEYMKEDKNSNLKITDSGSIIFADVDNDTDSDLILIGIEDQKFVGKLLINDIIISTEEIPLNNPYTNIFPNPFNNRFQIEFQSIEKRVIEIFSVTGSLIYSNDNLNSKKVNITLEAPTGIYLVRVTSETNTQQFKIIKGYQ